jgi:hypothetical protein
MLVASATKFVMSVDFCDRHTIQRGVLRNFKAVLMDAMQYDCIWLLRRKGVRFEWVAPKRSA